MPVDCPVISDRLAKEPTVCYVESLLNAYYFQEQPIVFLQITAERTDFCSSEFLPR